MNAPAAMPIGPRRMAPATLEPAAVPTSLTCLIDSGVTSSGESPTGRPSAAVALMNPMCTRALCPKMPGCETSVTVPSTGEPFRKMTDRPTTTSAATSNWTEVPSLTVAESIGARNLRGTDVPAGTSRSAANAGRDTAAKTTTMIAAAALRICDSPPHYGRLPAPDCPVDGPNAWGPPPAAHDERFAPPADSPVAPVRDGLAPGLQGGVPVAVRKHTTARAPHPA